jgi:hypothetical protein
MKTTTLLIALSLWVSALCPAAAASAVTRPQNTAAEALLSEGDGLRRQGTPAALRAAAGRYSQALEIFRASGLKESEAFALRRLGFVHKLMREDGQSAALYAQALALQRAAGDKPGELETLREAQAETRRKYPHPFHWAAFVLTGEPGAMAPGVR